MIVTHRPHVLLCLRFAYGVRIICAMHCGTEIVAQEHRVNCNSLDIEFIHDGVYSRSSNDAAARIITDNACFIPVEMTVS